MPIGSQVIYNAGDLILSTVSSSGNTFVETKIAAATSSVILFNNSGSLTSASLSSLTVGNAVSSSYALTASFALNAGGGSGTVSGATNYIAKFTSPTSVGTSSIYESGSNVGIGTTDPQYKLDIRPAGANARVGIMEFGSWPSGPTYAYMQHSGLNSLDPTTYAFLQESSGETFFNAVTGQVIHFRIGNSEKAQINSSGYFGVGHNNNLITAKLEVSGSPSEYLFNVKSTSTPYTLFASGSGRVGIGTNVLPNKLTIDGNVTASSYTSSIVGAVGFLGTASYALNAASSAVTGTQNYITKFATNTTLGNSVIYESGSNIGIGTTNPINKLSVNGTIMAGNLVITPTPKSLALLVDANYTDGYGNDTIISKFVTRSGSNFYSEGSLYGWGVLPSTSSTSNNFIFSHGTIAGTGRSAYLQSSLSHRWYIYTGSVIGGVAVGDTINLSEVFTISHSLWPDDQTYVGIDNPTPGAKLHVQGNISASNFTSSVVNGVGFWGTASYALNGGTVTNATNAQNAQDILVYVKNDSGQILQKGTLVRIVGVDNSSNVARVQLADFSNENESANTLGFTNETFAINGFGYVMTEGTLTAVDTSTFTSGDLLYLSSSGTYTNVEPTPPNHTVRLGQAIRIQSNNGTIYVRIDNGAELDELHNVLDTSTTSSYGDLLIKSGSVWINSKNLTGSYAITGSLNVTQNVSCSVITSSFAYLSNIGFTNQTVASDTSVFPTGSVTGGFILDGGIYKNGLYRTRFVKIDRSANLPLYIQETQGSSGSFSNLARFGTHANSPNTFEVFGSTNIQGSLTSSNISSSNITTANITCSNITASGNIIASKITSSGILVNGNLTVTGSIFASLFSASYIYITSSTLVVTDNILTLNALSPYQRYAGIEMYDSGSGNLSSFLWDGQGDYFFVTGSGVNSKIIVGPDQQTNLTSGRLTKATGTNIIGDSIVSEDGNGITVSGYISGSSVMTANITCSNISASKTGSFGIVGIGTSSPISKLEVSGGYITAGNRTSPQGAIILQGAYDTGNIVVFGSEYSSGGPFLGYGVSPSTASAASFFSSTPASNLGRMAYVQGSDTHRWYVGAAQTVAVGSIASLSEAMRINSSGYVGIGTTNPSYLLHLKGGGIGVDRSNITSTSVTPILSVKMSGSGAVFNDIISIQNSTSADQSNLIIGHASGLGQSTFIGAGESATYASNLTGWGGEYLYLGADEGVVAVTNLQSGPAAAYYPFTISPNGSIRMQYQWSGSSWSGASDSYTLNVSGSNTQGLLYAQSPAAPNALFVSGSGNVGIGTTSPVQLLELRKTSASAIALLNYNDTVKLNLNASSGNAGYVGMVTNHPLIFVTNDTEKVRIDTSGNVGIGVTNPSGRLHITASATSGESLIYLSKGSGSISQNFITAVNEINQASYRVTSDINGYTQQTLYRNGTSYVYHDAYWSSWINNANYSQGGLNLGSSGLTHGYGLTIARPATSGSLYVSGSSVFTGSVGISGSINLSGPIIYDNAVLMDFGRTTTPAISTNYVVLQNITGSYNAAFFDYFASSASNFRAGTVIAGWSGSSINYTEYSTTDTGNTNQLTMSVDLSSSFVRLLTTVSTTTNWSVKTSGRYL